MALDSYANLKQAVELWSHRTDVSGVIDDFIDIAESRINTALMLRQNEKRATASASTSGRFLALPDRFHAMRRLSIINGSVTKDIEYRAPEALRIADTSGEPQYFTITSQIEFDRTPASAYTIEMSYHAELEPLSDANTTNNVLSTYPTLYLYGTLAELHKWSRDDVKAQYYEGMFANEIEICNRSDKKGRYGVTPVIGREGWTP